MTVVPFTGGRVPDVAGLRRLGALGRAELLLLIRNRSALFSALFVPLVLLWALHSSLPRHYSGHAADLSTAPVLASGSIGVVLLVVLYATLVPAFVARREDLVLKRLRTGQVLDLEILGGTSLPVALIALVQCSALITLSTAALGVGLPENVLLLVLAVLLGALLTVAFAAVTSIWTRTTEMAQLTTVPLLLASVAGSGLVVPLAAMPTWLAEACRWLPLTPVMELVRLAWLGSADGPATPLGFAGSWSAAVPYLGAVLIWGAAARYVLRRWFRWEPRR